MAQNRRQRLKWYLDSCDSIIKLLNITGKFLTESQRCSILNKNKINLFNFTVVKTRTGYLTILLWIVTWRCVRPILTMPENSSALACRVSRRSWRLGIRVAWISRATETCIAVGNVSFDDWPTKWARSQVLSWKSVTAKQAGQPNKTQPGAFNQDSSMQTCFSCLQLTAIATANTE